jgi:hypothetical protein
METRRNRRRGQKYYISLRSPGYTGNIYTAEETKIKTTKQIPSTDPYVRKKKGRKKSQLYR